MLYKRKILCNGIERIREQHKPLDCMGCNLFDGFSCNGEDALVNILKSDGHLYLATRFTICTILKRTLYYYENVTKEKIHIRKCCI